MNSPLEAQPTNPSFIETLKLLRDIRLWRILILGFASGYPWSIIGASTLSLWLKSHGFSRTEIGLFGLVYLVYTINFLWAPMLDAVKFGWLGKIGQRRSWILVCQVFLVVLTLIMAATGPSQSTMVVFTLLAIGIGLSSATQDLAIDAYRITIIPREATGLISLGAAMATCGWVVGAAAPAALMLYLSSGGETWGSSYVVAALILVPVSLLVLAWFEEPPTPSGAINRRWYLTVIMEYLDTVQDFFKRHGLEIALSLLLFILLFKLGEAFLGRMAYIFYREVGFTENEIATVSKLITMAITIVFSLFAGALMPRIGVFKMLFFAGIAMAATNLMFAWIAVTGPDLTLFVVAVVVDGITSSIATVAFVAFITFYVSHLHAAGQYGALASLGNAGRIVLGALSGLTIDKLGGNWALFFVFTSVAVIPSLCVLAWIANQVRRSGDRATPGASVDPHDVS